MAQNISLGQDAFGWADAFTKAFAVGSNAAIQRRQQQLAEDKFGEDQFRFDQGTARANDAQARLDSAQTGAANDADRALGADGKGGLLQGSVADRANYITNRLVTKHGLSREGASALVGNFVAESRLETSAGLGKADQKNGTDSIGIAQWGLDRNAGLRNFARTQGKAWTDLNVQIDWAARELNTTHRSVGDQLKRGGNVAQLADMVMRQYEKPDAPSMKKSIGARISAAQGAFNGFNPQAPSANRLMIAQADGTKVPYGEPDTVQATDSPGQRASRTPSETSKSPEAFGPPDPNAGKPPGAPPRMGSDSGFNPPGTFQTPRQSLLGAPPPMAFDRPAPLSVPGAGLGGTDPGVLQPPGVQPPSWSSTLRDGPQRRDRRVFAPGGTTDEQDPNDPYLNLPM